MNREQYQKYFDGLVALENSMSSLSMEEYSMLRAIHNQTLNQIKKQLFEE